MPDNIPACVKLYWAAQAALERGDKSTHDDLCYEAHKAKQQEINAPLIEGWGGRSQERDRER